METSMDSKSYVIQLAKPTVEEFCQLRRNVGWGDTIQEMARASLAASLFHVVIRDDAKLVGMGRVVGDGFMYFYLQDILVDPDYQKLGVGHQLMEQVEIYLAAVAKKGATVGLLAAKGKESFYARYDYVSRPNDSLGCGMCKFI